MCRQLQVGDHTPRWLGLNMLNMSIFFWCLGINATFALAHAVTAPVGRSFVIVRYG